MQEPNVTIYPRHLNCTNKQKANEKRNTLKERK